MFSYFNFKKKYILIFNLIILLVYIQIPPAISYSKSLEFFNSPMFANKNNSIITNNILALKLHSIHHNTNDFKS